MSDFLGGVAYEVWRNRKTVSRWTDGPGSEVEVVSPPEWEELPEEERQVWDAVGAAVQRTACAIDRAPQSLPVAMEALGYEPGKQLIEPGMVAAAGAPDTP